MNSIPDPGFRQRNYSEDELNENLVDFDNLSEFSDSGSSTDAACDGFILSQAIENSDSSPQTPITIDEQPPANLPITIEQQNLQDQPPTKKRRRARIIESNSEEDRRTKTKLKTLVSSCICAYIVQKTLAAGLIWPNLFF